MMAGSHKQQKVEKEENCLDLRYQFLRGLIQYEEWQRTRHYLKSAAECTSRAIVSLELSPQPIRTPRHAQQLQSIGGETMKKLKKFAEEDHLPREPPLSGKFVSSAGALLVALKKEEDMVEKSRNEDYMRISEERLKAGAAKLCEERFSRDGFCQAWWRLEVLIKRGLIKRRFHKKLPVYQLLPEGQEMANRLIVESRNSERIHNGMRSGDTPWSHGPVSTHTERLESGMKSQGLPQSNGYTSTHRLLVPRESNIDSPDESENDKSTATVTRVATDSFYRPVKNFTPNENKSNFSRERDKFLYKSTGYDENSVITNVKVERQGNSHNKANSGLLPWQHEQTGTECCHGNDKGNDGLVMVIDSAEWSKDHENLTKLGAMLEEAGIAHTTTTLTLGDYRWKWRHGIERELPCLLVRKRAGDLSRTLKEGKFWSQVQKMVDWKKEFMTFDFPCELFYIIEGETDYSDRGQGPGRNPTPTQIKNAVLDLQRHSDIQVLQSASTEETLAILESINADLDHRIKTGKFDMMLEMEWEKCQETIINIDDSDEEVLPSSGRHVSTQRFSVNTSNLPNNSGNIHESKSQVCGGSGILKSHPLSGGDGDDLDDIYPLDGEMEDPEWLPDITHEPRSRDRVSETDSSLSTDTTGIHHKNLKRKTNSVHNQEILSKKKLSLSKPGRNEGKGLQNGFLLDSGISDGVEGDDEAPSSSHFGRHPVINETWRKTHQGENSGDEVEDWWNSRDKEPLVMYHNSYSFTPRTPTKDSNKQSVSINKVSFHTNEKNHKGVTSCRGYRPVSPGDEEGQSAGGSKGSGQGQEKVTQILDMFPALTREVVYKVLTRHSGDLNSCVEELLET